MITHKSKQANCAKVMWNWHFRFFRRQNLKLLMIKIAEENLDIKLAINKLLWGLQKLQDKALFNVTKIKPFNSMDKHDE